MAGTCCSVLQKWLTLLLYAAGLGLSGYALHAELSYEKDPENYRYDNLKSIGFYEDCVNQRCFCCRALCDVDESHKCTAVFSSKYGKGFGILGTLMGDDKHPLNQPNSVYGLAFYVLNAFLFVLFGQWSRWAAELQFYLLLLANFMSCYLGYLLYAVLKNVCYVCVATYGVNFLLLILHCIHRKRLRDRIIPEYSKFERQGSNQAPTLPTYDFKKNI